MSYQPGQNLYSQNGGIYPENVEIPVIANRAPTSSDWMYPIGKRWDYLNNAEYILLGLTTSAGITTATWALSTKSTGVVAEVTTSDSVIVLPDSNGNINVLGTGSITTVGTTNTATVELTGLTNHAVLVGAGTATITKLAVGTTGQVLTGATGADPAFQAIGFGSGLTAHGVVIAEGASAFAATTAGTNGQVLLGSTGADPAFGTLTTSTGIKFTTGAAALAIDVQHNGFNINTPSTGGTIAVQNAYNVTQAAQTSFALPTTAAVGDTFIITSATGNTSGWIITQAASQEIWANTSHTTNGATGTLAGAIHCSVVLMCTVANLEFTVIGGSGLTGLTFT